MKKNIMKSIVVIIILVSFLTIFTSKNVYAESNSQSFSVGNIYILFKNFISQGSGGDQDKIGKEITNEIQPIINMLYWIGVAVVIGASMFLGIQYFKTTGDPKAKAELQPKLVGFLISSVVLLSAYPIWTYLTKLFSNLILE